VRRPTPIALALVAGGLVLVAACTSASPSPSEPPASSRPSESAAPSVGPSAPSAEPPGSPAPLVSGPDALVVEPVAEGFVRPTVIANAGDGSGRLFIGQREGRIDVVEPDGSLRAAAFLDLTARVLSGGERGLLGIAFHPEYEDNGRFFVAYTARPGGDNTVSEFTVSDDPAVADPGSERVLLAVPDPAANHNGGSLAFDQAGYLYVSMGDGGGQNDQFRNGQNLNSLLGKLLRIDVDASPAAGRAYAIPPDNPFAGGGGAPEIWAYGLRNPWRMSFDRASGDLFIGDVGGGAWEEINRETPAVTGGLNYGWPIMEGRHCLGGGTCVTDGLTQPIAEYSHDFGCSVIGGYVYRGSAEPALQGAYVFADYCSRLLFTLEVSGSTFSPKVVLQSELGVSAFGEDDAGELYLVDFDGGGLYRVGVP
jgi:glucose/arabinose dehydrogenase